MYASEICLRCCSSHVTQRHPQPPVLPPGCPPACWWTCGLLLCFATAGRAAAGKPPTRISHSHFLRVNAEERTRRSRGRAAPLLRKLPCCLPEWLCHPSPGNSANDPIPPHPGQLVCLVGLLTSRHSDRHSVTFSLGFNLHFRTGGLYASYSVLL